MEKVRVEVSARHVHLTQQDLEALFGEGYKLKEMKDLTQPGQFASDVFVTLVGEKRQIEKVRVLGPCRNYTQVEISRSDAVYLGIKAPLRLSGKIIGSGVGKLVGPAGELELKEGIIVAKRHLHVNDSQANNLNVQNGQNVKIYIEGPRALTFEQVEVRVNEDYDLSVHLDTDEANAAGYDGNQDAYLILE